MERKCVALLSGGLDSTLAVRLMQNQGIAVQGLYLSLSWGCCDKDKAAASARQLGISLMVLSLGDAYLDVIRRPKYGYGVGMNPCVDCRIYMFRIAARYMHETGAGFVVTGEVLGQRPMSQRRDPMAIIEKESGLEGLLLRPLSAKCMQPTLPELMGIVDREGLLDWSGRSRQKQMAMAREESLTEYSTPAGGCLLTDEHFAKKTRDLFANEERPTAKDMELLALGRHFRLGPKTKVILGRNEIENLMLEGHRDEGYTCIRPKFAGPTALVAGEPGEGAERAAARLILKHTRQDKRPKGTNEFWKNGVAWRVHSENDEAEREAAAVRI